MGLKAIFLAVACLACTASAALPQVDTPKPKASAQAPTAKPPHQAYQVDHLSLGALLADESEPYSQFTCGKSTQFPNSVWCEKTKNETGARGPRVTKVTMLRTNDQKIAYINQVTEPEFFPPGTIEAEVQRLNGSYHASGTRIDLGGNDSLPNAVIVVWGDLSLEVLPEDRIKRLAAGGALQEGILVDYIGNLRRSAQLGLPVFRLRGQRGYVWSASSDRKNERGHLRFFAIDSPAIKYRPPQQKPAPVISQPKETPVVVSPTKESTQPSAPTATLVDPCDIEDVTKPFSNPEQRAHAVRKCRLEALGTRAFKASPKFYEYLVKKTEVASLPSDIPVLRVVFDERVFFDTARWDILQNARPVLNLVLESLRKEPAGTALFVAGHTDSRGGDTYNMELSVKRADSVAEALARARTGQVKVWRVGFGRSVPIRPNDTPDNMALNRRVEFVIASRFDAALHVVTKPSKYYCAESADPLPEFCREISGPVQQLELVPVKPEGVPVTEVEILRVPLEAPDRVEIPLEQPPIIELGRPSQ